MLKLKLSILLRTLYRYRLNTAIAVLGFSIALACAMVLLMKVYFSLSTDRQHANYDSIYRTVQHIKRGDGVQKVSSANYPMGEAIRAELPQALATSMIQFGENTVRQNALSGTPIKSKVAYAENSVFDIFSFDVLAAYSRTHTRQSYLLIKWLSSMGYPKIRHTLRSGQTYLLMAKPTS
jgi:putative ABC transport system permease protein